jgi:hypothetical protein
MHGKTTIKTAIIIIIIIIIITTTILRFASHALQFVLCFYTLLYFL